MSLYNTIFGMNPLTGALLAIVGLEPDDVGRFRDCYLEVVGGEPRIMIYTRNGNGNREHRSDNSDEGETCDCLGCITGYRIPNHPLYVRDFDDDFDDTYATFEFSVPNELRMPLLEITLLNSDNPTPAERWDDIISSLKSGDTTNPAVIRATEAIVPILEKLRELMKANQHDSRAEHS